MPRQVEIIELAWPSPAGPRAASAANVVHFCLTLPEPEELLRQAAHRETEIQILVLQPSQETRGKTKVIKLIRNP